MYHRMSCPLREGRRCQCPCPRRWPTLRHKRLSEPPPGFACRTVRQVTSPLHVPGRHGRPSWVSRLHIRFLRQRLARIIHESDTEPLKDLPFAPRGAFEVDWHALYQLQNRIQVVRKLYCGLGDASRAQSTLATWFPNRSAPIGCYPGTAPQLIATRCHRAAQG